MSGEILPNRCWQGQSALADAKNPQTDRPPGLGQKTEGSVLPEHTGTQWMLYQECRLIPQFLSHPPLISGVSFVSQNQLKVVRGQLSRQEQDKAGWLSGGEHTEGVQSLMHLSLRSDTGEPSRCL